MTSHHISGTSISRVFLLLAALHAPPLLAQVGAPDASSDDTTQHATVEVTGSRIKHSEYTSISPVQVIEVETNRALGQMETAEFLQKSSIAAGATQFNHQFGIYVTEGGTGTQTLSLRGLGATRSLVLLNGHRPGPAGTQGRVGAFDLNVVPSAIIERIELLKDGASSIYGSDAVAGVSNIITRRNITTPEITVSTRMPIAGGGEVHTLSAANGWMFANGNITLAGEYWKQEPLKMGDRRFLRCAEDLVWDANGRRINRVDNSIIGNTRWGGCDHLLINAVDDLDADTTIRYVPSWDGTTIGNLPGYRPRINTTYDDSAQASYTEVRNFPQHDETYIVQGMQRSSAYAAANFSSGAVNWNTEILFNRRESEYKGFWQYAPTIANFEDAYPNDPDFRVPNAPSELFRPIMPFRDYERQRVDYYYLHSGLDGLFANTWSWSVDGSWTRSRGMYEILGIDASKTGDWDESEDAPTIDYLDPGFLSGERIDELVALIGVRDRGHTIYDQSVLTASLNGELMRLPWAHAGVVSSAIGAEYRKYRIDDQPGFMASNGLLWDSGTARVTRGDDTVKELFAELEADLLGGLVGAEKVNVNISARWFDYASIKGRDSVWKAGLGWQIVPALRLRATKGTSFRAPGLYEQYLDIPPGFLAQFFIDPCIDWNNSTNPMLRANCAAAGIPSDHSGRGSPIKIYRGGGLGLLKPETSNARTAGLVWTPTAIPLSIALDYFEITVNDQISSLGAINIARSCYGADVWPNNFCNMLVRNPGGGEDAYNIREIYSNFLNINKQKVRGYDLVAHYESATPIGKIGIETQITQTREDVTQVFDTPLEGGELIANFIGAIGRPKWVGNLVASLNRRDWTWTWGMDYVAATRRLTPLAPGGNYEYFGYQDARVDSKAASRMYHSISAQYAQDKWSLLVGLRNVFNTKPDRVSAAATDNRYGNTPAFATQYDYYGISLFARWNYRF